MAKKPKYTAQTVETYAIVSKVERRLTDLYGSTYQGVLQLAQVRRAIQAGQPFTFEPNRPETKALIKSLDTLAAKTDRLLESSVSLAWQKGEDSVTNACYSAFGRTQAARNAVRAIADRAREDLRGRGVSAGAFYTQKHGGLNISDRVWGNSLFAKQEIEDIIQQGILQGKSADEISRSVRGYLSNPSKLFRRVRNKETGALELSKAAKNYHPGRGVYRSSYQNALRLARTEVNAAYRRAEWESYQNNPLITGYKIELSNNHTTTIKGKKVALRDICDELAGEYPKSFQWTGWHPQCRCRMVPIFIKEGDFRSRIRALAAGKLDTWKPSNTVTEPPKAFTDWVADNADRLKAGKQMPYFIADNYVGGDPTRGLVKAISSLPKQVQESKKIEPVTEYDHEIASLDRWAKAFDLDTTQAKILRDAGDRKGLRAELDRLQQLRDDRHVDWMVERRKLSQIIDKMRAGGFSQLADQYNRQGSLYETKETVNWKDGIKQLKALQGQAAADLAAAEEAKAKAPKKDVVPEELKGTGGLKEGDKPLDPEFWKYVDPDHPIPVTIKDGTGYYSPSEKRVYIDKDWRYQKSPWFRRGLVYHEFGHGIDFQRDLRKSKEVATIREAQRKRLLERVPFYKKELELAVDPVTKTGKWVYKYTPAKVARADAICKRVDAVNQRIQAMKEETFNRLFPGITKRDIAEQVLAMKDTIKSLTPSYGEGHSTTYFRGPYNKETEWLAHCFENKFAGNRIFQKYMPEEYKEMIAYIESLKKY